MFERRLKICLGILLSVISILLLRAIHLQVITRSQWVRQAEDFKKRAHYLETTRGRILDVKGHELAIDEACTDACVDYRAIVRDETWIRTIARGRASADAEAWKKLDRKQREEALIAEIDRVKADIDAMFTLLAQETGVPREKIDETCRQIDLRVSMSRRRRQYVRYLKAHDNHIDAAQAAWYRRWIIEGGKDGPQVDDYADTESEEVGIHPIVRNVSPDAYLRLALRLPQCPGLALRPGSVRKYPHGRAAAHLLGTVSTVHKEDLDNDAFFRDDPLREYQFNDLVGRGGLEALCEPSLRGARGKAYRSTGTSDEIESQPVPGRDVRSTIDINLQNQIQQMFAKMEVPNNKPDHEPRFFEVPMHGAAVVIDVKSGAVRALVSYPDYDLNTLGEDFPKLLQQKLEAPLLNRATQSQLDNGSTIKPVVGLGAITQGANIPGVGVVHAHSGIECTGYLVLNGHKFSNPRCWVASNYSKILGGNVAHHPVPVPHRGEHGNPNGFLTFADGIERSCNVYFAALGDKLGIEGLSYWYERFGLGRETGLGISEAAGRLPRDLKRNSASDAWFSAIGQVGVWATPIQMANVAATIARDGIWVRPHLVEDGYTLNPVKPRNGQPIPARVDLKLNKEALAAAREGMVRVVNGKAGTGAHAYMSEMTVAGKTGTAEVTRTLLVERVDEHGKTVKVALVPASADHPTDTPWYRGWGEDGKKTNHSWFIGFAPAEEPQVAFAVMVEWGGSGGATAGRLVTKILTACIEHGHVKPPVR